MLASLLIVAVTTPEVAAATVLKLVISVDVAGLENPVTVMGTVPSTFLIAVHPLERPELAELSTNPDSAFDIPFEWKVTLPDVLPTRADAFAIFVCSLRVKLTAILLELSLIAPTVAALVELIVAEPVIEEIPVAATRLEYLVT